MKKLLVIAITLSFVVLIVPSIGLAIDGAEQNKWSGHVILSSKLGNKRNIGEAGLFIPVVQDDRSMLFLDLRGNFDDHSSEEGNYGIGYRKIMNENWIIGGYGFFDLRRTQHNNTFTQGTFGIEALSEGLDFRLNAYIPESTKKPISGTSSASAYLSGTRFSMLSRNETLERALPGIDLEAGLRVQLAKQELRLYAGGFYFDAKGYDAVKGPRGRAKLVFNDLFGSGKGSQLILGCEAQYDDVRGKHFFGIVQVKIPFGSIFGKSGRCKLSGLEQRMTTYIQRDVDILAGEQVQSLVNETATAVINGTLVSQVDVVVSSGDDIVTEVTNAGANSMVMVDGTVDANSSITMLNGQTLIGSGITFTGDKSGFQARGTGGRINQTNIANDVIELADNAIVSNLTVQGGKDGLEANGKTGVTIRDLTILNSKNMGIDLNRGSHNATVERVTIENNGIDGIVIHNSDDVVVNDTFIVNPGGRGILVWIDSDNTTISNTTISNPAGDGIVISGDDSDGHTLNNVSINNVGNRGLWISGSDNMTVNNVGVNGAGNHAFYLNGSGNSITGLSGSGNSWSGLIGGNACETSGTIGGSFSFTNGGSCP